MVSQLATSHYRIAMACLEPRNIRVKKIKSGTLISSLNELGLRQFIQVLPSCVMMHDLALFRHMVNLGKGSINPADLTLPFQSTLVTPLAILHSALCHNQHRHLEK